MKTSNKILLITLTVILFITVILITITAVALNQSLLIKIKNKNVKSVNKNYNINDFDSIQLEGFGKVKIIKNDTFAINIEAPDEIIKGINLDVYNKTLVIKQKYFSGTDPLNLEMNIFIPTLKRIIIKGINQIDFTGFNEEEMILESIGFNKINGKDSSIKNIKLSGSYVTDYDLTSSTVVNVKFTLSDFGTTKLNITDGKLEGQIKGSIIINYKGNVRENNLNIFDEAKLIKTGE